MKIKYIVPHSFTVAMVAVFLCLFSCSRAPVSVSDTRITLGTYVKIIIVTRHGKAGEARKVMDDAYRLADALEIKFDYRHADGALGKFNGSSELLREEDPVLFDLVHDALSFSGMSGGAFDPTVLPLMQAWGFDTDSPHLPTREELKAALELTGYGKTDVRTDRIGKPPAVKLDLGGIAKGKIVDLIRDHFLQNGYENFLVDGGGDIYIRGTNSQRTQWRIAIQDPEQNGEYIGILEKSDTAVVTSGDYENYFETNGIKYSHLLNPRTGYPSSDCMSVTVLSEDTGFADAMATAVFVMGSERGMAFLREEGIEGFIVFRNKDGKREKLFTPGFWD